MKSLVVFFSQTGHTRKAAHDIAKYLGSEILDKRGINGKIFIFNKIRPYIICHMIESVDGRIYCDMVDKISGEEYYTALNSLECASQGEDKYSYQLHHCGFEELGSGMGGTDPKIANATAGSNTLVGKGLAVQGKVAQENRAAAKKSVDNWLKGLGF